MVMIRHLSSPEPFKNVLKALSTVCSGGTNYSCECFLCSRRGRKRELKLWIKNVPQKCFTFQPSRLPILKA